MRTLEIIRNVNDLADENESNNVVLAFLNQAIAKINAEMNCEFPDLELSDSNQPSFPTKWQRTLLIPFAVGRMKQKDSSQFEYTDAYSEFLDNLDRFRQTYIIPLIYRTLKAGQMITLEDDTLYEAQDGDTLYSIALEFGMDAIALRDLNHIITQEESIQANFMYAPPLPWFNSF